MKELIKRLGLSGHEEGGYFKECNEDNDSLLSGAIYYYLGPNDKSTFHAMDEEDEYWCYTEGESLEIWELDKDNNINIKTLGLNEGESPLILVKKGTIFGARHKKDAKGGTLVTCITVPRFKDEVIYEKEEILSLNKEAERFYE